MSQTTFSSDSLKDKVNEVVVQYGCSLCGATFHSEQLCDKHIDNCVENPLNATDPLGEGSNNRAPKRKLDRSTGKIDSASLCDDSSSNDVSGDGYECKKVKEFNDSDLKHCKDFTIMENPLYEATSHMISENEMLITLPYDQINDSTGGPLDFSNEIAVGFEQHTEQINTYKQECEPDTYNERDENTVIIENYDIDDYPNIYKDSTVKILSIFATKPSQEDHEPEREDGEMYRKDTAITINADSTDWVTVHTENTENDSNKVLAVLSTVNVNKIGTSNEKEVTVMDLLGLTEEQRREGRIEDMDSKGNKEGKGEGMRKTGECVNMDPLPNFQKDNFQPNNEDKERIEEMEIKRNDTIKTPRTEPKNSETPQNYTIIKNGKNFGNQKGNPQENRKQKRKSRKRKSLEKISVLDDFKTNKELLYSYKEITRIQKEEREEIPEQFAVFEFYDEEEEKLKAKIREDVAKEKAIKKRTCSHCNEIFKDPMDVLRHKRKFHKFEKIFLPKEQMKQYLDLEDKTECPLCFKFLSPRGFKSLYVKHLLTHSDEYGFACNICHMQFRRKDHWHNHESRHVVKRPLVNKEV